MPKYGLTGGIASGKTIALQIFNEYGVDTIDTDELARLVINRGTEGARNLKKAIGVPKEKFIKDSLIFLK
mgnify:CR=1 FL=1